ncbi:hypothetical protein J7K50_06980 [bacterium]|nr:hypothetical protein [bacterium]
MVTFLGTATASPGGSTVTITRRLEPRYGDSCPPGQTVVDCGEEAPGNPARETIIGNGIGSVDSVQIAPGSEDEFLDCLICLRCLAMPIAEVEESFLENLKQKLEEDLSGGGQHKSESGTLVGECIC